MKKTVNENYIDKKMEVMSKENEEDLNKFLDEDEEGLDKFLDENEEGLDKFLDELI